MFDLESLLKHTVPDPMLKRGLLVLRSKLKPIRVLFEQRRVPEYGWDDETIDFLFTLLSMMDTDKDPESARIGEREARVASPLISKLAHGFCHGVGRSGHITASQPKAAGGSLMYFFANKLALDMLRKTGVPNIKSACVVPVATGMAIGLAVGVARDMTNRHEIVYPRVDHRSPIKGMQLVGAKVKIIDGEVFDDAVRVPVEKISESVNERTAGIVTTTTFFPPREPDDIKAVAKLAAERDVPHIINNAYGVQSRQIMKLIRGSIDAGRVDAVVQSTDKNFLTPVGGAIVASPSSDFVERVSRMYAGRATATPVVEFLAALLSLGIKGYEELRSKQEHNRLLLHESLRRVAQKFDERILNVFNPIAVAMTLKHFNAKKIGRNLYASRVTGPRVLEERDFGVCCQKYHSPYITINAAIGSTYEDVIVATERLEKVLKQSAK